MRTYFDNFTLLFLTRRRRIFRIVHSTQIVFSHSDKLNNIHTVTFFFFLGNGKPPQEPLDTISRIVCTTRKGNKSILTGRQLEGTPSERPPKRIRRTRTPMTGGRVRNEFGDLGYFGKTKKKILFLFGFY